MILNHIDVCAFLTDVEVTTTTTTATGATTTTGNLRSLKLFSDYSKSKREPWSIIVLFFNFYIEYF